MGRLARTKAKPVIDAAKGSKAYKKLDSMTTGQKHLAAAATGVTAGAALKASINRDNKK